MTEDIRFDRPLYSVDQAARLVGMPPSTFRAWSHGYQRRFSDRPDVTQGPVITSVPAAWPHGPTIPFVGLIEAVVVQAIRRTELPLQRIRRAIDVLVRQGELRHPLASRRLYTDGAQILYDYAADASDGQLRLLTVVDGGQRVFHDVITDYLQRIEFDGALASSLVVPVTQRPVLRIRPDVADGDAIFIDGGAPLGAVLARVKAGEPVASVAADFDIAVADVHEALDGLHLAPVAA